VLKKSFFILCFLVIVPKTFASQTSTLIEMPDWFSPKLLKKLALEPGSVLPLYKETALTWSILEKGLSWEQAPPLDAKQLFCKKQTIELWADSLAPKICRATLLLIAKLSKINTKEVPPPTLSLKTVIAALLQRTTYYHKHTLNPEIFELLTGPWLQKITTLTPFFGPGLKIGPLLKESQHFFTKKQSSLQPLSMATPDCSIYLTVADDGYAHVSNNNKHQSLVLKGNLSPKALKYIVESEDTPLLQTSSKGAISDVFLSQDGTTAALVFLQHYLEIWKLGWAKQNATTKKIFFCETDNIISSMALSSTGNMLFFETKSTEDRINPYALFCVDLSKKPQKIHFICRASTPISQKEASSDGSCFVFMRGENAFVYVSSSSEGPRQIFSAEPIEYVKLTRSRLPLIVATKGKNNKPALWVLARPLSLFTLYCIEALKHSNKQIVNGEFHEKLTEKFKENILKANDELIKNAASFQLKYTMTQKPTCDSVAITLWAYKKNTNLPVYPW